MAAIDRISRGLRSFVGRVRRENSLKEGWHSFDRTPWKHPWLSSSNLSSMRNFSESVLADVREHFHSSSRCNDELRYAFVGNIANNLYMRAAPLRRKLNIDVFLHPEDRNFLSHPSWEEFDGEIQRKSGTIDQLEGDGISLPSVPGVFFGSTLSNEQLSLQRDQWIDRFSPMFGQIGEYDAVLSTQCPYLARHSQVAYLVAQCGGDIWFEASRADRLGFEQREGFRHARAFLVSNPWSYAHARRYGFKNLIHVPLIVDDRKYSPGKSAVRADWTQRTGGKFFVLSTSRVDEVFKGSSKAMNGFREFSKNAPDARLVMLGWGNDIDLFSDKLRGDPISEKILFLPMSGKVKLVEYLRAADCLLDQFILGYYGATAIEAMLSALPVIMRLEHSQYDASNIGGAPPVENCSEPNEITGALRRLYEDVHFRDVKAAAVRSWALDNHGASRWEDTYRDLLFATATGFNWDYSKSPLSSPLTKEELDYQRAELAAAPPFPSYY